MKKTNESLGQKIVRLRAERRMTQDELAQASGVPRRTIQNMEADAVDARYFSVVAVLEALGVGAPDKVIDAHEADRDSLIVELIAIVSANTLNEDQLRGLLDTARSYVATNASKSAKSKPS